MTYRVIVIDDERTMPPGVIGPNTVVDHYRTSDDALAELHRVQAMEEPVEELWLDHDLAMSDEHPDGDTIWPVVTWLEEQGHARMQPKIGCVFIHTQNPVGGAAITDALGRYYTLVRVRFPTH